MTDTPERAGAMVERVARAIAESHEGRDWDRMMDHGKDWWRVSARAAIQAMDEGAEVEFEVWQDDMPVAHASAADEQAAWREALHYAAMYGQDGPVEIKRVVRTTVRAALEDQP